MDYLGILTQMLQGQQNGQQPNYNPASNYGAMARQMMPQPGQQPAPGQMPGLEENAAMPPIGYQNNPNMGLIGNKIGSSMASKGGAK
jgi:hypothetical protein